MAKTRLVRFQEFRIQINPISREFQQSWLEPEVRTMNDLLAMKNEFFNRALDSVNSFSFAPTEITHQKILSENSKFIFRIGAQRQVDLEKKDFSHQAVENWPSLLVMIDNEKSVQTMLIEKKSSVFQLPKTVAGIFEDNVNRVLASKHLQCYIRPMFEESNFWDLVRKYQGNIKVVDFALVTPNMANISRALDAGLKKIVKDTNSAKTNIRLESAPDSALKIDPQDPIIKGLVNYTSEGGGGIGLKIRNLKRKVSTTSTVKETSISELEINGKTPQELLETLKMLLK